MPWTRFLRRGYWDAERAREIEAHLAIETDDNIARGMPPDEARAAARRKLGNLTLVREDIYHMNTIRFVETMWQDVRYAGRLLRKNPAFAVVATLSLALGIGANTAIFQLLDSLRLRSLPVPRAHELAEIRISEVKRTGQFLGRRPMLTNPLWEQLRDRQQGFSGVLAWGTAAFDLAAGGEERPAQGLWVSGDYFRTLGISAAIGRVLTPDDDRRNCAPRAVISDGFWQREFGHEPSAVGKTLLLDGHPFEVVGVTPPRFYGVDVGRTFDVAVPICAEPIFRAGNSGLDKPEVWFLAAMGRLKPGWSIDKATAQLEAMSPAALQQTLPPSYNPQDAKAYLAFKLGAFPAGTGVSTLRRQYETPLWLLLAIAGLVLLIACANLANLMLARGTVRAREMAVRLAIGASRGRIIRQLVVESLVLSVAGAAIGAALAQGLSRFLVGYLSVGASPVVVNLDQDWMVFAFTAGLAMLTCLLVGLTPALRATRTAPAAAMKAGSRGVTDDRERFGLRRALVVAQVALSLMLVVGALLFVRTLRNLTTLDPGFRQDDLLAVSLDLRRAGIAEERRVSLFREITGRLAALPGVASAAQSFILPVSGSGWNNNILVDGITQKDFPNFNAVGPAYFRTMGTPILAGRDFDDHDTSGSPKVAIVNESFAKKFFGGRNAIGRVFQVEEPPGEPRPLYEVIAVVKDTKYTDLREPFGPIGYFAASQTKPDPFLQVILRLNAPSAMVTAQVTQAVVEVNRAISLSYQTMKETVERSLLRERLMATLSGFFGALAALLAAIGLYGMLAYMVARRRSEIGIRMALGAGRGDVVRMIMREAAELVGAGVLAGAVLSVAAGQAAATLLFGLRPSDPLTLTAAIAALTVIAVAATFVPARRASRLDPTVALREE